MSRRVFRPMLAASTLESRICLSQAAFNVRGAHVRAYGNAVNPGRFDGLVEVRIHGQQFNAVFGNGHRITPWLHVHSPHGRS
jgi:hypothetical protein